MCTKNIIANQVEFRCNGYLINAEQCREAIIGKLIKLADLARASKKKIPIA